MVPETAYPMKLKDFRLVASTSHLMEVMKRIIINHNFHPLASGELDPLQFTYHPGIGVGEAVISMQHRVPSYLKNTARVVLFDFSGVFTQCSTL